MNTVRPIINMLLVFLASLLPYSHVMASCHTAVESGDTIKTDSLAMTTIAPVLDQAMMDFDETIDTITMTTDMPVKKVRRDWKTWRPNPTRSLWLALVLPGAGQIYNRKFWKLPIVYGGFVGSIYAMQWNNMMYHDYSQAYLDLMDSDPTTQSYNQFMHLGAQITSQNEERYKKLFQKRKDYYRRYRDLSFFVLVGVYALSVIDAYVDASLSDFDISKDLSMKVSPTLLRNETNRDIIKSSALGLQCSFIF